MSDVHTSPGRLERWLLAIPDGAVLRLVFLGILAMGGSMLAEDVLRVSATAEDADRVTRTEPLPLSRPVPGDQVRPYLPRAIPVGPDRGRPTLPGYDAPLGNDAMSGTMRFRKGENGAVSAVGRIDPGTADELRRFLDGEGSGTTRIVLHSPGGSVTDAIAMARLIREHEIDTQVPVDGYCASACPLVLAGGLRREAGEQSWVGLHQVYAVPATDTERPRDVDRSISEIQATIAECQTLLVDMNIDPSVWIHAIQTPPDELYVLTPEELSESRFTGSSAPSPAS